ncbi:MAG: asparagine synthetase B, partial [Deltaproteobacteria bacterium]|nr:asparagine synthetase B [Deltaproteobacteria bacterium]
MSIIFGLVGRNGQPVAGEELGGMQKSYTHIPADGSFLWREGEVGLGVIQRYDTPESTCEVFPQHSRCGRHTFVSHARLDNREELLRRLEIPPDRAS